jgi:hypothetical protein
MRSAEIELVDAVNDLDTDNTANKASIESLQAQIGDGFSELGTTVTSVTNALSRTVQAQSNTVAYIMQTIGNGFDTENTVADAVEAIELDLGDTSAIPVGSSIMGMISQLFAFSDRFRIGETEEIELSDGDPYAASEVFATPFGQTDNCILYAQVISSEPTNRFDLTITECSNTGFSYSVAATDSDPYTIRIGYVAVCTNA